MTKRNVKQWYRHGNWWRNLWFNRKYKDVLFRRLFRDKKDLLELYNALNGSTYKNAEELEVVTMEDVIFMKMKNDLSFIMEAVCTEIICCFICPILFQQGAAADVWSAHAK